MGKPLRPKYNPRVAIFFAVHSGPSKRFVSSSTASAAIEAILARALSFSKFPLINVIVDVKNESQRPRARELAAGRAERKG